MPALLLRLPFFLLAAPLLVVALLLFLFLMLVRWKRRPGPCWRRQLHWRLPGRRSELPAFAAERQACAVFLLFLTKGIRFCFR